MECIKRSKISLKLYQKKVIYFMAAKNHKGLLVVHPTGYGKTLTAVAYSQCFLDTYKERKVIFIAPASLIENFKGALDAYGVKNKEKYLLYSKEKFLNDYKKIDCKGNLLIIDEVHNLRNMSLGSNLSGLRSKAALFCAYSAKKVILLTATPFVNDLKDLIALVNLVHGSAVITKPSQVKTVESFKPYLRGMVDYIKPEFGKEYPEMKEHTVKILMPKNYEKDYCKLIKGITVNEATFSSPRSFYNAHRRAVNKTGQGEKYFSLKMEKAVKLIGKKKSVIYSNWLEFGLDPIADALESNKISFEGFSGSISKGEKKRIVEDFNNDEFQVLIITSSGKEGLDLKGVRNVIIIDPVWNYAGIRQIRGRAVRYKSHAHLPENERKVDIYYLLLETSKKSADQGCLSGDSIVYKFVENKKNLQKYIDKMLMEVSI